MTEFGPIPRNFMVKNSIKTIRLRLGAILHFIIAVGHLCCLFVLDEAFDNLDAQGSESLVTLITSEMTEIDSIFIITHHADIAVPYDKIIEVIKNEQGVSSIIER